MPKEVEVHTSPQWGDDEIGRLLQNRQVTHGDAWIIIGQYLSIMHKQGLLDKILETPYGYAWIMMFAKLVRITQNPGLKDNTRDVEGYARLIREHME